MGCNLDVLSRSVTVFFSLFFPFSYKHTHLSWTGNIILHTSRPTLKTACKEHNLCMTMSSSTTVLVITERALALLYREQACLLPQRIHGFSQGPFLVATSCGSPGSTQPWQEQVARPTPTRKVSERDRGSPTAAPWTLLWQQNPLGSQAALLEWGPGAGSPPQKTRDVYLDL